MSSFTDNLIAFKILYMLTTPFENTDAYKFGIIDKEGNKLKKLKDLNNSDERDSYSSLHRLVFSLKRLLAKVPGGSSQIGSLIAAYYLIKENRDKSYVLDEDFYAVMHDMNKGIHFIEEEITVEDFIQLIEEAPTNSVGDGQAVSTDYPAIKKKLKKNEIDAFVFRRKKVKPTLGMR